MLFLNSDNLIFSLHQIKMQICYALIHKLVQMKIFELWNFFFLSILKYFLILIHLFQINLIFFASVFCIVKCNFNLIIYNTKKSMIIYSILIQLKFTLWLTINCFADIDSLNEIFRKLYFWFSSLPLVITWQKKQ